MSKKDKETKKKPAKKAAKKDTKKAAPKKAATNKTAAPKTAKKPAAKKAAPKNPAAAKAKPSNGAQAQQQSGQTAIRSQNQPYTIHAQYVRDASFENPNAIDVLRSNQPMPEMDINIGMDARKVDGTNLAHFYEVALNIRAEAKRGKDTVFIAELQYGIAVSIEDSVPQDSHHPLLLIEIPRMAFPYARKILSDLTVEGGYPPLLLNPVDFQALYVQRFGQKA